MDANKVEITLERYVDLEIKERVLDAVAKVGGYFHYEKDQATAIRLLMDLADGTWKDMDE